MIYDVIIVGSGPAGITAGIYAKRAGLSTIVLEGSFIKGGQIVNTQEIDNYPGLPGVGGIELAEKMRLHLEQQGVEIKRGKVIKISQQDNLKMVHTKKTDYCGKTVVLASGTTRRTLDVPGEEEFLGSGVSYCATCDGAFFKEKTVAVIGGGDVAIEDADILSGICKKVYVIHRRSELRAAKVLQDSLYKKDNVELRFVKGRLKFGDGKNSAPFGSLVVTQIGGELQVQWLKTENLISGECKTLDVDGVFIAIGSVPNTEYLKDIIHLDSSGYIVAGEDGKTNIPGIFAAGDVRTVVVFFIHFFICLISIYHLVTYSVFSSTYVFSHYVVK